MILVRSNIFTLISTVSTLCDTREMKQRQEDETEINQSLVRMFTLKSDIYYTSPQSLCDPFPSTKGSFPRWELGPLDAGIYSYP